MVLDSKVVNFDELKAYKKIENEILGDELENFDAACQKMRKFFMTDPKELVNLRAKKRIIELEKENETMANKLQKSIPVHIITYLTICSFIMGASINLLILTYPCDMHLINPYYIICALLISLTLFCTAVAATKDWKEYL